MQESHINDYYEPCEENIESVVRKLDIELKFKIKKNKNFRIFLLLLFILNSIILIVAITALSLAIVQQSLINELKIINQSTLLSSTSLNTVTVLSNTLTIKTTLTQLISTSITPITSIYSSTTTPINSSGLWNVFNNFILQSSVTSVTFNGLVGFCVLVSSVTQYYLAEYSGSKIHIFTDDWSFISSKSYNFPNSVCAIGNNLLISSGSYITKTDSNLNVLIQYTGTSSYQGLFYNPANDLIYVAAFSDNAVHIFNSTIYLRTLISVSPETTPWSITGYKNQIYVGMRYSGNIVVISMQSNQIINTLNGCNSVSYVWISSIVFDQFGLMATSCLTKNQLNLFYSNQSYAGKSLSSPGYTYSIGYDSKGRFIIMSYGRVDIWF